MMFTNARDFFKCACLYITRLTRLHLAKDNYSVNGFIILSFLRIILESYL